MRENIYEGYFFFFRILDFVDKNILLFQLFKYFFLEFGVPTFDTSPRPHKMGWSKLKGLLLCM